MPIKVGDRIKYQAIKGLNLATVTGVSRGWVEVATINGVDILLGPEECTVVDKEEWNSIVSWMKLAGKYTSTTWRKLKNVD